MKTTFDRVDGEYGWETRNTANEVVDSGSGFSNLSGAKDDFFTKHPTLDRNSVQSRFDGTKFVYHN